MLFGDIVTTVLAFLTSTDPVGAALFAVAALLTVWAASFFMARAARRLPGRKSFDVGGGFDHFHALRGQVTLDRSAEESIHTSFS